MGASAHHTVEAGAVVTAGARGGVVDDVGDGEGEGSGRKKGLGLHT